MKRTAGALLLLLAVFFCVNTTLGASKNYHFFCITNTNEDNAAIGESQISVIVSDYAPGQALFTFLNIGAFKSTISEIYFDDGTLLGIASIMNPSDGVVFVQDATPPDLPDGGNANPSFNVTAGFLAEAESPATKKGVNPGQQVGILFDLKSGGTWQDVVDDLADGSLRIGAHVVSIGETAGSESFINTPEPATLLMLGLGGFFLVRSRKR